jgi:hypothetical protein
MVTVPDTTAVLPKRELPQPYILQIGWGGDPPCLEVGIDRTDPGAVASEDLGVHLQRAVMSSS